MEKAIKNNTEDIFLTDVQSLMTYVESMQERPFILNQTDKVAFSILEEYKLDSLTPTQAKYLTKAYRKGYNIKLLVDLKKLFGIGEVADRYTDMVMGYMVRAWDVGSGVLGINPDKTSGQNRDLC